MKITIVGRQMDVFEDTKAMIDNINSWEKLSPEFKAKVAAQTAFEK